MDVRAAVATAAGKPLEIMTVQLEGPSGDTGTSERRVAQVAHHRQPGQEEEVGGHSDQPQPKGG